MNQRGYLGGRPTLLDVAKGAVETFVKVGGLLVGGVLCLRYGTLAQYFR